MAVAAERSLDAEQGVIGSILIDPDILPKALATVDPKDFQSDANRRIFQAAAKLFRSNTPVDPFTIRNEVGAEHSAYMAELMALTPTSANWELYTEMMRSQALVGRAHTLAPDLAHAMTVDDLRPVAAELNRLLEGKEKLDSWTMRELYESFLDSQSPDAPKAEYITTGFPSVDEGNYLELGDVAMIGGYPSDGKTALALSMAYHMAKTRRVGFFSFETDKSKIRDRLMSTIGQLDFNSIKRRTLTEADRAPMVKKQGEIVSRDLTVLRAAGLTASAIEAASRAYGFEIIFLDYVQQVIPETDARAGRTEQVAQVSRSLHTFAQRTKTLVVELAQLSRADKSGGWREPTMFDLKETGQFEQDADLIFLLFRPNPKPKAGDRKLDPETHRLLKVAKNKEGRLGKWPLYFDGSKQTFSIAAVEERDIIQNLTAKGKAARVQNRTASMEQVTITELPGRADGLPF